VRIAYFDTFSGIAGDMTIAALVDAGVPFEVVEKGLEPLGLRGYRLELGRRVRSGITARKFDVHVDSDSPHPHEHVEGAGHRHGHGAAAPHEHRHYAEIRELLAHRPLPSGVRSRAQRIFHALAIAEGRVHDVSPDEVAFHEVGAIDAIVDIVGASICLEHLGVDQVYAGPLPLGGGFARTAHGVIPIPAPATLELLRGFTTRPYDGTIELVTPTGAAILAALATPAPPPELVPEAIGYGAGERELADRPNLLRVVIGRRPDAPAQVAVPTSAPAGLVSDERIVLETNIDDMSPELFEPVVESLFAAGAHDVTLAPIWMKKGRPGTLLQVIATPSDRERLVVILLRETSTIGVRGYPVSRWTLPRSTGIVATEYGPVAVKTVVLPDGSERTTPEYDDCRRLARERGVPVAQVHGAAQQAAHSRARGR
jgi:pyridinium-3,5-bisthiocarboxylic acid mononucleotide nickel chelatase